MECYSEIYKLEALLKGKTIISVVGAGGKTSLILHYAGILEKKGSPAVITTTTHMYRPTGSCYGEGQMEEIKRELSRGKTVWVGERAEDQKKIKGVSNDFLRELFKLGADVLIEADGAKRFPCKVPAVHEPVIPVETKIVIGVAGLDCLGRSLLEGCFRSELVAELLGTDVEHCMGEEDLAYILTHPLGTKKGIPPGAEYGVVLNKCDLPGNQKKGERVRRLLAERGCREVVLGGGLKNYSYPM